jgi:hypothetical protein
LDKKFRTKINRGLMASAIIAVLVIATAMPVFALQPVTLTLIGSTGTTITKNATEILAMPSVSGLGGTRGSSGTIGNYGTYQGVSLLYLCNLVGGIQNGSTIRTIDVTGNFTADFTYEQVQNGTGFATYSTNGTAVNATQLLTVVIAYSLNGTELSSSNGPLRAVIVGPEGLASTGSYWNKQIATIQIIPPSIPEFMPDSALALILCFMAIATFVAFKKGLTTPQAST